MLRQGRVFGVAGVGAVNLAVAALTAALGVLKRKAQTDQRDGGQDQHHRGDELAVCDGLADLCTALKAEGVDQDDAEAWYPNGCRGSGKVRAE